MFKKLLRWFPNTFCNRKFSFTDYALLSTLQKMIAKRYMETTKYSAKVDLEIDTIAKEMLVDRAFLLNRLRCLSVNHRKIDEIATFAIQRNLEKNNQDSNVIHIQYLFQMSNDVPVTIQGEEERGDTPKEDDVRIDVGLLGHMLAGMEDERFFKRMPIWISAIALFFSASLAVDRILDIFPQHSHVQTVQEQKTP